MIGTIIRGWIYWQKLKIRFGINYKKVVIVLADENQELDRQVLLHLPDFVQRKYAESVMIFYKEECEKDWMTTLHSDWKISVYSISNTEMARLYSYYCIIKFFDNIVFTYTDNPEDNLLGTYLRNTDINEEEAACLALYHLRCVPNIRR